MGLHGSESFTLNVMLMWNKVQTHFCQQISWLLYNVMSVVLEYINHFGLQLVHQLIIIVIDVSRVATLISISILSCSLSLLAIFTNLVK